MTPEQEVAWERWLSQLPGCIQAVARLYPPGTRFRLHGKIVYAISYTEYDNDRAGIGVSEINPAVDYQGAINSIVPFCDCCMDQLAELKDGE